jgi:uncharacterized OB-fold protein
MLPILALSPCGHEKAPTVTPLDQPGVVYSWTRVWLGSEENGRILAMADFLNGQLRVTAPVVGVDQIAIGDSVEVTVGTDTPLALRPFIPT